MAGPFLEGMQLGAGIAGDAMDRNLRMQELRSREALRQVQERAAVQEMELLMEKRSQAIQYQADMTKALSAARIQTSKEVPVFGPTGVVGTVPNPNPLTEEEATFRNILPVIAQYEPNKVPNVLQSIATSEYRRAQANQLGKPRPLAPETVAATQALERQRQTSADANIARTKLLEQELVDMRAGKGGTAPNIQKEIEWFENVKGVKLSREELGEVLRIKLGLDQKAGTAKDRGNATLEVFKVLRPNRRTTGKNAVTDDQVISEAKKIVDSIYEEGALGGTATQRPAVVKPQKGKRVIQNGFTYEFDGTKWNAVK